MALSIDRLPGAAAARTFRLDPDSLSKNSSSPTIQVELRGSIAPGWILVRSLPVWIQQDEDGEYLANDEVFCVYGEGATPAAAQKDYVQSLLEYYEIISAHDDAPSRQMLAHLRRFLRQS